MKMKKTKKVFIVIISVILFCIIGVFSYSYYQLNKVKKVDINKAEDALGIKPNFEEEIKESQNVSAETVRNILFLGIDKEEDASDSIIVASIDENNKKLKMTSIMRDSYVDFEGQTIKKINYAYHFGGPQFAIKTINENFDLNIKDYIKVDFEGLVSIIDALGGVEIKIKDYEVSEMTSYGIKKPGTYNLTGKQALGYSRIRHVGKWDYERTQRQRTVLDSLLNKAKAKGAGAAMSLVPKILPSIETSMTNSDIIELGNKIFLMAEGSIEQLRLPLDDYKEEVIENERFYLKWDRQPNVDALHKFIYGQ
jgi:polyisoprenyl-teichoic acid--peptidoglycan teichoic acid transferase